MITIRQRVYAWLERNVIATLDPDDTAGYSDADRDAVESTSPTCLSACTPNNRNREEDR